MNIERELAELRRMTPKQLRERYHEVFGERSRSGNKGFLIKRIAWRLQAIEEGDLSERARRRAAELARDADLRIRPPREPVATHATGPSVSGTIATADPHRDPRLPMPGSVLTRTYKGDTYRVHVLPDGFDCEGVIHRTLSAVARAITGSHTNGYLFFRLGQYEKGTHA